MIRKSLARGLVLIFCLNASVHAEFGDELFKMIPFGTDEDRIPEGAPEFGVSVGISDEYVVVGAEEDSWNGEEAGAAWAYNAQTGEVLTTLEPADAAAGDGLGQTTAVSGILAVVGADSKNGDEGAAYVFDIMSGTQTKLTASDSMGGEWDYGQSADIDGTTAIIGAEKADSGLGAAYIVDLATGAELKKLFVEGETELGNAVGIHGNTAIVSTDASTAYLFDVTTGEMTRMLSAEGSESYGAAVAINDRYVVVSDDDFNEDRGQVYIYDLASGDLMHELSLSDGMIDDKFGTSLALEGSTLLVGTEGEDESKGAVFVYDALTGTRLAKIQHAAAVSGEEFGSDVDISNGRAVIGAVQGMIDIDGEPFQTGSAFVFDLDVQKLADINNDEMVDAADINALSEAIRAGQSDKMFDLNDDGSVNEMDRDVWVHALQHTYFGDANLDGEFGSGDLTLVFTAGEYEDGIDMNSTWETGDWNGNGDFGSEDLVAAFTDGGYELGPRAAVAAVPEPNTGWMLLVATLLALMMFRRRLNRSWGFSEPRLVSIR